MGANINITTQRKGHTINYIHYTATPAIIRHGKSDTTLELCSSDKTDLQETKQR